MSAALLKSGSPVDTSRSNIVKFYSAFIQNSFFTENFERTASVACLVISDLRSET